MAWSHDRAAVSLSGVDRVSDGVILVHDPTPKFAQAARRGLVFEIEPPGGFLDAQNVMVRLQMLWCDQHHAGALQNGNHAAALQRSRVGF